MADPDPIKLEDIIDTFYGAVANFVTPKGQIAKGELVNYVIPTMPMTPDDTFFLDGVIPTDEEEPQARIDAFEKRRNSARQFAVLMDFVPSVTPHQVLVTDTSDVDATTLSGDRPIASFDEFRTKGFSMSQAFEEVINSARVLDRERSAEEQERIDQLRALLEVPEEEEDETDSEELTEPADDDEDDLLAGLGDLGDLGDFDDPESFEDDSFLEGGEPPTPTKLMQRYLFFKNLYETAEMGMIQKLIEIENDPANARFRARLTAMEKKKLRRLRRMWMSVGRKNQVERIQNILNALEQGGMVAYRDRIQERMENSLFETTLVGLATDSTYYTGLVPANLFKAQGWQKISLNQTSQRNHFKAKDTSFKGRTGFSLPFGLGFSAKASKSKSVTTRENERESLHISFEIAQGLLDRPWFDPAFLASSKWTMADPASGESLSTLKDEDFVLSDGGSPPKGVMPAYVTAVILVRNVRLRASNMKSFVEDIEKEHAVSGKAGFFGGFGLFSAGGGHTQKERERLYEFDSSSGTLSILGTHIVAFRGTWVHKAPDPNFEDHPNPRDWV